MDDSGAIVKTREPQLRQTTSVEEGFGSAADVEATQSRLKGLFQLQE